jgi:hypothetical protein
VRSSFAIFTMHDGDTDTSQLPQPLLDCVHKNQAIPHNDWLAQQLKFLSVQLHLVHHQLRNSYCEDLAF